MQRSIIFEQLAMTPTAKCFEKYAKLHYQLDCRKLSVGTVIGSVSTCLRKPQRMWSACRW